MWLGIAVTTWVVLLFGGQPILGQRAPGPAADNTPPTDRPWVLTLAELHSKITADKAGRLLEGLELFSLNLLHRSVEPATVHGELADLYFIQEGSATLETGGTILNPRPGSRPADLTGSGISGGKTQVVNKGDIVFIPPGVPHRFSGGDVWYLNVHFPAKRP